MKTIPVALCVFLALSSTGLAIENGDFYNGDAHWNVYVESANCSATFYPHPDPNPHCRLLGYRLETTEIYQAETGFNSGETWRATFDIRGVSKGGGGYATIGWTDDAGNFGSYLEEISTPQVYTVDCDNASFYWVTVHAQGSMILNSIIDVDEISTNPIATPTPIPSVTPSPTPAPGGYSLSEDWATTLPAEKIYAVAFNPITNHMLIASRDAGTSRQIGIYDADSGIYIGSLLLNPQDVSRYYFAMTVAEDGRIYSADLLVRGTIYRWDDEGATPVQLNVFDSSMFPIRSMRAYGSGTNTVIFVTGMEDNGPIEKWTTADLTLTNWSSETLIGAIAKTGVSAIAPAFNIVYGIQPWGPDETNPNEGFPERFDFNGSFWERSAGFAPSDIAPLYSFSYSIDGDYADNVLWVFYYFHNLSGNQYQNKDVLWGLDATTGAKVAEYIIPANISYYGSLMADPANSKIYWGATLGGPAGGQSPQRKVIYGRLSYTHPPLPTPSPTSTPTPTATPTITPTPSPTSTPIPPSCYFKITTDWLNRLDYWMVPQAAYNPVTHHLLVNNQSQIIVYDAETGEDAELMLLEHPENSQYFSLACSEDGVIYATEFWQYGWLYRWQDEWSTPSLQTIPDLVYVVRNINVRGTGVNTTIYATGGDDNSCIQILKTDDGLNFYIDDTITSPAAKSDVGVKDENTVFGIQAWGFLDGPDYSRDFPARFDKIGGTWVRSSTFQPPNLYPVPGYNYSHSLAGDWADDVLWTLYFRPSVIVGLDDVTGEKVAQWDCPYEFSLWAGVDVDSLNRKIYFGATVVDSPNGLIGRLSYEPVTSSTVCMTDFETGLEEWNSGPLDSVFTPPVFTKQAGAISMTTTNNTNTFGFWQSPEQLFEGISPMVYRARIRVSSDVTSWELAPGLRFRFSRPDFQQTDFLVANITQPEFGGFASESHERVFDLYFAPSECPAGALSFAFDVLSFDPTRASEAILSLENLEISEISPALLGTADETWQYTFDTGAQGWVFSGEISILTPPHESVADGALILIAVNNVDTFGYWQSPQGEIPLAANSLYRAVFNISADTTVGNGVPTLRLRAGSKYHQLVAGKQIDSFGDALNAPTSIARDYVVYFATPEFGAGEGNDFLLALDVLNFDPDNSTSQTIRLHNIRVERFTLENIALP